LATTIYSTIAAAVSATAATAQAPLTPNTTDLLLSRFAFGPTQAARDAVKAKGITGWYNDQVALGKANLGYGAHPVVAAQGPLLAMTPAAVREWLKLNGNEFGWEAMDQLTRVTLGLQVWSPAQLYETLVDFFANHLNVANHSGDLWNTRHAYDRDVIRAHAMGSFTAMLLASARHPAMLLFLDLARSTKKAVNENYGRELLELHTVGMVCSETDVLNASRLLTGRTVDLNANYTYLAANHWTGAVKVLGFSHANTSTADGQAGADAMVKYLASHPATAQRLAQKLCVRFVSDNPSATLVSAVAKAYLDSGTQILPMVSVILRSNEFWASRGKKVRRPAENFAATLRILDAQPAVPAEALKAMHWMTAVIGQVPLDWTPPDGYPDVAAKWCSSSSLLRQWELHLGFAGHWWGTAFGKPDRTLLYGGTPANSGDAVRRLGVRLTGGELSATHRAALQTFLGEPATTPMASSTLRWLLAPLVALILDGPHCALR
jgi:hypothetical protein